MLCLLTQLLGLRKAPHHDTQGHVNHSLLLDSYFGEHVLIE